MHKVIYAPESLPPRVGANYRVAKSVFLAGSIEMGAAEEWQTKAEQALADLDIFIFNPRRKDWDSSWEQKIDHPKFREQVEWELEALSLATHIIMYFDPATKSPISLLELGLYARSSKLLVVCPDGFWRKGNVDVVCEWYAITQYESLEEAYDAIRSELS